MVNTCESAIKIVTYNKRKWLTRLNQNGKGGGNSVFGLRFRDPDPSRSTGQDLIATSGHCVMECDPRLLSLYTRSFPTATVFPSVHDELITHESITWQIRVGDLSRYFRPTLDRFPVAPGYLITPWYGVRWCSVMA